MSLISAKRTPLHIVISKYSNIIIHYCPSVGRSGFISYKGICKWKHTDRNIRKSNIEHERNCAVIQKWTIQILKEIKFIHIRIKTDCVKNIRKLDRILCLLGAGMVTESDSSWEKGSMITIFCSFSIQQAVTIGALCFSDSASYIIFVREERQWNKTYHNTCVCIIPCKNITVKFHAVFSELFC